MRILKNTRGVSPVLTVLLMIAVAVTASFITYMWVMTYLATTTRRVEHAIQIVSVDFVDSSTLHIYVQNIGKGSVQLTQVYINGAMISEDIVMSNNGFIKEGETCTITITYEFKSGEEYHVKVVCSDGTSTEGKYKA